MNFHIQTIVSKLKSAKQEECQTRRVSEKKRTRDDQLLPSLLNLYVITIVPTTSICDSICLKTHMIEG